MPGIIWTHEQMQLAGSAIRKFAEGVYPNSFTKKERDETIRTVLGTQVVPSREALRQILSIGYVKKVPGGKYILRVKDKKQPALSPDSSEPNIVAEDVKSVDLEGRDVSYKGKAKKVAIWL